MTTASCAGRPIACWTSGAHTYGGNLLIALPDAFGTKPFLRDAPDWVADWTGFRPDSAPPIAGRRGDHHLVEAEGPRSAGQAAGLLRRHGRRLDRGDLPALRRPGAHRASAGAPTSPTTSSAARRTARAELDPISLVCKVTSVDGRPAVKLSDNPEKATGSRAEESSAICACSAMPAASAPPCTSEPAKYKSPATNRFDELRMPAPKPPAFETLSPPRRPAPGSATGARAVPIYQTTSYVFQDSDHAAALFNLERAGHIYTRISNPTTAVLEERLAALESGVGAVCTASGMAALHLAIATLLNAGDHIVASASLYGGTINLLAHTLPRFGITTTFVKPRDLDAFRAAIKPNTQAGDRRDHRQSRARSARYSRGRADRA